MPARLPVALPANFPPCCMPAPLHPFLTAIPSWLPAPCPPRRFAGFQSCSRAERWPGLFEVPVWHVRWEDDGKFKGVWSMVSEPLPFGCTQCGARRAGGTQLQTARCRCPLKKKRIFFFCCTCTSRQPV